ncbi:hypothetical protein GQX74_009522 [Glossina fuscipes]|nr:hypothetical protein GQX74_009522 [Glossina fuscipes]
MKKSPGPEGFQTANGKKETTLEESQKSVQNFVTEFQGCLQEKDYETGMKDIKDRMESSAQIIQSSLHVCRPMDTPLLALDDESKQTVLKSQNTWQHLNVGHSALNVPMMIRNKRLLSLNQKKKGQTPSNQPEGLSPNELFETAHINSLQTGATTPELGEFLKNAVETSTPCINRKLPLQKKEKDPDTLLTKDIQSGIFMVGSIYEKQIEEQLLPMGM